MMKKSIYKILTEDVAFTALIPKVYERGSVPDAPVLPFAIYAFVGSPRQGRAFPYVPRVELWCYQERGDYSVINDALSRADDLFEALADYRFEDERIAEATPQGWSGDLYDDVFKANTRNSAYLVIGSGR